MDDGYKEGCNDGYDDGSEDDGTSVGGKDCSSEGLSDGLYVIVGDGVIGTSGFFVLTSFSLGFLFVFTALSYKLL